MHYKIKNSIYLDYAASTPLALEVAKAMDGCRSNFGNPGSLHLLGQRAISLLDEARQTIAQNLGANFNEIIFTGSATEANNLALRGAVKLFRQKFPKVKPHLIVSSLEHESVLATAKDLATEGVGLTILGVSREGVVNLEELLLALRPNTVLVSIMHANNETGVIQPLSKIAEIIEQFRQDHKKTKHGENRYPLLHTDAAQSLQFIKYDLKNLGVDLLTISAQKIYGPKGVGALYVKRKKLNPDILSPVITGGGQEYGLRSGTENISGIVGFARAINLAAKLRATATKRLTKLRLEFESGLKSLPREVTIHSEQAPRLPHIVSFRLPGVSNEKALIKLDQAGICLATGPACSSRSHAPSHVLLAMGLTEQAAKESLRASFGRDTDIQAVQATLQVIGRL